MNKGFKYQVILVVSGAILLVACEKFMAYDALPDGLIAFNQDGLVLDTSVETKATEVTESTLDNNGFNVSCSVGPAESEVMVWNNAAFSKFNGVFIAEGEGKWWPTSDPNYLFFASNSALTFTTSGCTVAASNTTDVVCAYLPSSTYKQVNSLTFNHIFARIGSVTVNASPDYTISGVSIRITPKTSGTYNVRIGNNQTDGTGWSNTLTGTETEIANASPGIKSNDIYLVPGIYSLTATWTAAKEGEYTETFTDKTYDISVTGGKVNSISATLSGNAEEINFFVYITPWESNNINAKFRSDSTE